MDFAWEEMRKVLDRELPQRRRRGLLWWIFPGLLGIASLVWLWWPVTAIEQETKLPISSESILSPTKTVGADPINNTPAPPINPLNESVRLTPNARLSEGGQESPVRPLPAVGVKKTPHSWRQIDSLSSKNAEPQAMHNSPAGKTPVWEILPVDSGAQKTITDNIAPEPGDNSSMQRIGMHSVASLERPGPRLLDLPGWEDIRFSPDKNATRSHNTAFPKRFSFGVEAGALVTPQALPAGAQAGLTIAFTPLRRWSLVTGLGYRTLINTLGQEGSEKGTIALDNPQSSPAGNRVNEEALPRNLMVTNQAIYVPLRLQWNPGGRWQLSAGVQWDYLLQTTRQEDVLLGVFQPSFVTEVPKVTLLNGEKGTSINKQLFKDWGLAYGIGLGYQLNADWMIQLRVHRAWQDRLSLPEYQLRDTNLWLGMSYQF